DEPKTDFMRVLNMDRILRLAEAPCVRAEEYREGFALLAARVGLPRGQAKLWARTLFERALDPHQDRHAQCVWTRRGRRPTRLSAPPGSLVTGIGRLCRKVSAPFGRLGRGSDIAGEKRMRGRVGRAAQGSEAR
ncbi:MAG: hypothetical protein RIC82_06905, partial [Parvibaculum sp.]